jgi:hypothetical protein
MVSSSGEDYLVDITRTNGIAGISWDSIQVRFNGNDEGERVCQLSSPSNNSDCIIIQNGGQDDSMWEPGESITLREGEQRNLHENSGSSQTATIEIMLLNEDSTNDYQTMDAYSLTIN